MKDAEQNKGGDAPPPAKKEDKEAPPPPPAPLAVLRANVALIEKAVAQKEPRTLFGRVLRQTAAVRKRLTGADLATFLESALPAGPVQQQLVEAVKHVGAGVAPVGGLLRRERRTQAGPEALPNKPPSHRQAMRRWRTPPTVPPTATRPRPAPRPARRRRRPAGCPRWRRTAPCWRCSTCWTAGSTRRCGAGGPSGAAGGRLPHGSEVTGPCVCRVRAAEPSHPPTTPQAQAVAGAAVERLGGHNRRTLDVLAARIYSCLSLAHERGGSLASIRSALLGLHRTAVLRHDEVGRWGSRQACCLRRLLLVVRLCAAPVQAQPGPARPWYPCPLHLQVGAETLLNLLLRNYLHYNLYDQVRQGPWGVLYCHGVGWRWRRVGWGGADQREHGGLPSMLTVAPAPPLAGPQAERLRAKAQRPDTSRSMQQPVPLPVLPGWVGGKGRRDGWGEALVGSEAGGAAGLPLACTQLFTPGRAHGLWLVWACG